MAAVILTQELLKSQLHYDPETGIFTWAIDRPGVAKDSIAGSFCAKDYWAVQLFGKKYKAHRLAWFYMYGVWPKEQIDHINRIKTDNRICNLREATNRQNKLNSLSCVGSVSRFKGVSWMKERQKWIAQAMINGKQNYLGLFETQELASEAYKAFAKANHGEFYREA